MSTTSPPGISLTPGVEIPHVAGSPDGSSLPPGEACYSCNVDTGGVPLVKRTNGRRQKRETKVLLNYTQVVSGVDFRLLMLS